MSNKAIELLRNARRIKAVGLSCYTDNDESKPCNVVAGKDMAIDQALAALAETEEENKMLRGQADGYCAEYAKQKAENKRYKEAFDHLFLFTPSDVNVELKREMRTILKPPCKNEKVKNETM